MRVSSEGALAPDGYLSYHSTTSGSVIRGHGGITPHKWIIIMNRDPPPEEARPSSKKVIDIAKNECELDKTLASCFVFRQPGSGWDPYLDIIKVPASRDRGPPFSILDVSSASPVSLFKEKTFSFFQAFQVLPPLVISTLDPAERKAVDPSRGKAPLF